MRSPSLALLLGAASWVACSPAAPPRPVPLDLPADASVLQASSLFGGGGGGVGGGDSTAGGVVARLAGGVSDAAGEVIARWTAAGGRGGLALERARYRALADLGPEPEREWLEDVQLGGTPAGEALVAALRGTGYELLADGHEHLLSLPVELVLEDVPRVRLVEEVAAAVGLVPIWSDPDPWGKRPATLSFQAGTRVEPVTCAGPFLIELALDEAPPHGVGTLTVTARALGLPDGLVAANAELGENVRVDSVRDAEGRSLVWEEAARHSTAPLAFGSSLVVSVTAELRGLRRSVERLEKVRGSVRLELPELVGEARFEGPSEVGAGAWTITCQAFGETSQFEVRPAREGIDLEDVGVRFDPADVLGAPLPTASRLAYAWSGGTRATVQTLDVPAAVGLKAFRRRTVPFAFEIAGFPLRSFARQPERIPPLEYSGSTPIAIDFRAWGDLSDPEFPEVELVLSSRANKDVREARATLEYLDTAGEVAGEFRHTFTGDLTFDGPRPLLPAGASKKTTVTAFFRPLEARSARVRVDQVSFVDGMLWRREELPPSE